jgi:pyridoxine 5'-phosphate synthase PdxJ
MEFLFHSDSPFAWNEEKEFAKLVEIHGGHYARAEDADTLEKIRGESDFGSKGDVPRAVGV